MVMSRRNIPKPDFMDEKDWFALLDSQTIPNMKAFGASQAKQYIDSNGEEGGESNGGPVLVLTTTGRKSGLPRPTALVYMGDGEDVCVVGSLGGMEVEPDWSKNLRATPNVTVQIKDRVYAASARMATAEERAALWPRLVAMFPLWGHFQKYSEREFPVWILSPAQTVS
jgi:deazaflavin-dependent oxidoreductase (nitroreductase family)